MRARARRGWTLVEGAVTAAIVAGAIAAGLAMSSRVRGLSGLGESSANLKELGAGYASYAADHADRLASFTWRRMTSPSQFPDLNNAISDLDATANQAVDIIRRRSAFPTFPRTTNWVPQILYNHLVILDYLDRPLPSRGLASPEDATLLEWQRTPTSAPVLRLGFSSSYQTPPALYSPDVVNSVNGGLAQATSHNQFYVVQPSDINRAWLGHRRYDEVAYPSHKAMMFDSHQRHFGQRVAYFGLAEARVPVLNVDGSLAVRSGGEANPGWDSQNPGSSLPVTYYYSPAPHEPPAMSPSGSDTVMGRIRWTRRGLGGRDFDGPEIP